jgi:uncharacterized LabA/DUF88 family protein
MKPTNKKPITYAFIDSQNLNLGVRSQGWRIDYKKFRLYLKNKYNVDQAFMFIGMVISNQELYTQLQRAGFVLIFKPTIQYFENGLPTVKGNVDAELVLHAAAIEYPNYDKAIIVSGDGDFHCLVRFLKEQNKLLHLMTPTRHYSKLLREFSASVVQIQDMRNNFEYKKSRDRRSVETLGLPGHGDTTQSIASPPKKGKSLKIKKSPRKDGTLQGTSTVGDTNRSIATKPGKAKRSRTS